MRDEAESGSLKNKFWWLNRVYALRALVAFLNSLIFLAVPALMAAAMYVSVLAMPAIAAGLSGALGLLGLPQAVITFLAVLPIIAVAAIFLRFLQIHWEIYQARRTELKQQARADAESEDEDAAEASVKFGLTDFVKLLFFSIKPSDYFTFLIQRALFLDVNMPGIKKGAHVKAPKAGSAFYTLSEGMQKTLDEEYTEDEKAGMGERPEGSDGDDAVQKWQAAVASAQKWRGHYSRYNIVAGLAALGLGGYLAYVVMPFLIPAVMSLGVPFPVAVLFGVVAAATIIAITYQLLASLVTLRSVYMARAALWKSADKGAPLDYYTVGLVVVAGLGILVSAGAAYLFFTPLVNALAPVLSEGLAIFTAVAVSVGLTLLMMRLLPEVLNIIIKTPAAVKGAYTDFQKRKAARKDLSEELPLAPRRDPEPSDRFAAMRCCVRVLQQCMAESKWCAPCVTPGGTGTDDV